MRIRRKKHLEARLDAVKDYLFIADYSQPDSRKAILDKRYFDFSAVFGNDNPVELEIGCGKGGFIIKKSQLNPIVNYLAVELLNNIIVMACENALKNNISNLRFFNCGADYLARYIKPDSISNIYLNFSPPFPGDRYENRRLTNTKLVEFYKDFLVSGGHIYLKTDDKDFYDYSYSQFLKLGFEVVNTTEDVLSGKIENVKTEYETKFLSLGKPIYYLSAKLVK